MEDSIDKKSGKSVAGIVFGVIILAVIGVLVVINGGNAKTTTQSQVPAVEGQSTSDVTDTSGVPGNVKEFTIDGSSYKFTPDKIEVKKGDTVKIIFIDDDGTHNLVIDGYNIQTKIIKGGSQDTVEFVADKAGTFKYYCSVGEHEELGMAGELIVN